jgi:cobalt-zinc-cadmium efflux system outer membrane protein
LRKAIANRQIQLAELGFAQFRAALGARARSLALAVLSAQERARIARDVAERARQLAGTMVQRDPAGITPLLETRILEASAVTSQHRAADAQKELQAATAELNQLRGAPPQLEVAIARPELSFPPAPSLDEILASAQTNNFELKMRRLELEEQGFRVQLARNERFPSFTVGPFYSEERARDAETQVGIGVSIPIPVWNRNKGNIEFARARHAQAEASLQLAQRDVNRRVLDAFTSYKSALEQLAAWPTNAARHFQEAAELGDRHYRLGAIPISTYVEIQKQYVEAIEVILGTQVEADQAWGKLALLAGWIHNPDPKRQPSSSEAKP